MKEDLVGQRFGNLIVKADLGSRHKCHLWLCQCDCGKEVEIRQVNLKSGHTKSCGCKYSLKDTRHFVDGTCLESIQSQTLFRNNTSGVRGVYWNRRSQRWVAQITFKGKTYNLGSFEDLKDAEKARSKAEQEFYQTFLQEHQSKQV